MENFTAINPETMIKVKLTKMGQSIYNELLQKYNAKPKIDKDGFVSMTLSGFFNIFNEHSTKKILKNNRIYFPKEKVQSTKP